MAVSSLSIAAKASGRPTTVLLDEVSSDLTYVGLAAPNSATSAPVWQVRRIQRVGNVLSVQYANGAELFENVWDDRESLTYR